MTPAQKLLVQTSFEKVLPIKETAAELFYTRLFELDPSLQPLFKGDMQEQGRKLMTMLLTVVRQLDRLEQLAPAVQALGQRHIQYGVKASHYETVGQALLWTLEQGLGPDFTPDTKAAWVAAYGLLSEIMKKALSVTV